MALTDKQSRFVDEYLTDLNATQAARRAGYSAHTAKEIGSQLLGKPEIADAIAAAQAKTREKLEITREEIAAEMYKLGFANMLDFTRIQDDGSLVPDFSALDRRQAAALAEVAVEEFMDGKGEVAWPVRRTKIKLSDKRAALESLSRLLGFDKQLHEHTGKDGEPLFPAETAMSRLAVALLGVIHAAPHETERHDR